MVVWQLEPHSLGAAHKEEALFPDWAGLVFRVTKWNSDSRGLEEGFVIARQGLGLSVAAGLNQLKCYAQQQHKDRERDEVLSSDSRKSFVS